MAILETLTLTCNEIKDIGACSIVGALNQPPYLHTLKTLELASNGLTGTTVAALASFVARSTGLITLDLHDNQCGDEGAKVLATVLTENATLQSLDLSQNEINNPGARSLASALPFNTGLRVLHLQNNNITQGGGTKLEAGVHCNNSLRGIFLDGNDVGEDVVPHPPCSICASSLHRTSPIPCLEDAQHWPTPW
jgi:hypothetical protein